MYRLTFETRNFTFEAFGTSQRECEKALRKGWKKHCKQYPDADKDYLTQCWDSLNLDEISLNSCMRDHDILYKENK
jgi:hypothetical protein